jgi:hypothetical protein
MYLHSPASPSLRARTCPRAGEAGNSRAVFSPRPNELGPRQKEPARRPALRKRVFSTLLAKLGSQLGQLTGGARQED